MQSSSSQLCRPVEDLHEGGYTRQYRRTWHHDSVLKNGREVSIWRYLCENAEHKPRNRRSYGRGPREVPVGRGEILISISELARYFLVDRGYIRRILRVLLISNRVELFAVDGDGNTTPTQQHGGQCGLIVKVLNYNLYQYPSDGKSNSDRTPSQHQRHPHYKEETKGVRKESRKERKERKEESCPSKAMDLARNGDAFDTFWQAYPSKQGKKPARTSFARAVKAHGIVAIMEGLARYKRFKPPDRAWLHPTTFLNQERYLDDPEPQQLAPARRQRPETIADKFLRECNERATAEVNRRGWPGGDVDPAFEPLGLPFG